MTPGPIRERDRSLSADNGTPYVAWATIGSVVLAHPSELALLYFLTTEATAVGSHPTLGVLLDEISGSFTNLTLYVPDPPLFVASATLFSDRFYISEDQQPAACRHFQLKISWPAEAAKNELLSWAIIGAHAEER